MKALILPTLLAVSTFSLSQNTSIPDPIFEQFLIDMGKDAGPIDGMVPTDNINDITELYIQNQGIADLTGIEDFIDLEILRCDWNMLTTLDLSQNTELNWMMCSFNQLTSLDISNSMDLYHLNCEGNNLTTLDLSGNIFMQYLNCAQNNIATLDLSQNDGLTYINCWQNDLAGLDVSNLAELTSLWVGENQVTALDVSQNPVLVSLSMEQNLLTALDISNNPVLQSLACYDNALQCLNVRNGNNAYFTGFDATGNPALTCIEVDDTVWANDNWMADVDAGAMFSVLCGNACSSNMLGAAEQQAHSFSVYPNPASNGVIYVNTTELNLNYQLVSITGAVVQTGVLDSQELSIDKVRPGVYLLRVSEQDVMRIARVVVK